MRTPLQLGIVLMGLAGADAGLGATLAQAQERPSIYQPSPTSSGFELPSLAGSLRWSLSGSERATFGGTGSIGTLYSTNLAGNVAYLSQSTRRPTSLVYSLGYLATNQQGQSSFFHDLNMSQVLTAGRWNFVLADSLSYLPQTRVAGLSGIAGLGDLGIDPTQLGLQSTGPQSNFASRVTNIASGSAIRPLTGRTSIAGNGAYTLIRFPGASQGIDTTDWRAGGTLTHQISGRTSINGSYDYSQFSYALYHLTYKSQGGTINFTRQYTRRLSISAGAGPQYTVGENIPSRLSYALNGRASYTTSNGIYSANFGRAVRTGSGVTTAGISDDLALFGSRQLSRFSTASLSLTYDHTNTLPTLPGVAGLTGTTGSSLTTTSFIGSAQFSRSISRYVSVYGSYSALHQSVDRQTFAVNSFQGLSHTVAIGVTYSPKPIMVGKH